VKFEKGGSTKASRSLNRQNGGREEIEAFKHSLKSQNTGRWRQFKLYNECDLDFFAERKLERIETENDDDCATDDETLDNGVNYNRKKLLEVLNSMLGKNPIKGNK
jgi:hypothetical protein